MSFLWSQSLNPLVTMTALCSCRSECLKIKHYSQGRAHTNATPSGGNLCWLPNSTDLLKTKDQRQNQDDLLNQLFYFFQMWGENWGLSKLWKGKMLSKGFSATAPVEFWPISRCQTANHTQNKLTSSLDVITTGWFFSLVPPKKLKYGKPKLGESTLT